MAAFQSKMSFVEDKDVNMFAQKQAIRSDLLLEEILAECEIVREMVELIRVKLEENLNSRKNISGSLQGCLDDYLESFELQIEKLKARFASNHDFWLKQAASKDTDLINEIQAHFEGIECRIHSLFVARPTTPTPQLKLTPALVSLQNFGCQLEEDHRNFEWPTDIELQKLELTEPLRLMAVKTKGFPNGDMTAIQLIFEGGVTSPMFDSKARYRGDELSTVEVSSSETPFKRITSRVYNAKYTASLSLDFDSEEKTPVVLYNKKDVRRDMVEEVREIPEGHQIVGVYGRLENNYVRYLGFKVAKF